MMLVENRNMNDQERYDAVINCDGNYDGLFFYGVKTTGIFCRPSCQSKNPKQGNLMFFRNPEEARNAGFRPCKRCRSDLLEYKPMQDIASSLKDKLDHAYQSQSQVAESLDDLGMSERRLTDIFKETYGITPKVYVDSLRLKEAERLLEETDEKVLDIAMNVGFGSLSTFNRFFKEQTGYSPVTYRKLHA